MGKRKSRLRSMLPIILAPLNIFVDEFGMFVFQRNR
jgi:hypothetical protein